MAYWQIYSQQNRTIRQKQTQTANQSRKKKSFSCLYMKNINHKIPRISPKSNVEIDSVMSTFENSTFKAITEKWNTITADYFLYYKSSKCFRFISKYLHLPMKVEDVFYSVLAKQSMFKCLTLLAWNNSGSTGILILPYLSLNRFGPFAIWKSI